MATPIKRSTFFDSEEGEAIRQKLQHMTLDSTYNTEPSYSANTVRYPDNLIPFVDKHMDYLNAHPKLEAHKYLANIKLKSRIR
jgi:hypothetical protein